MLYSAMWSCPVSTGSARAAYRWRFPRIPFVLTSGFSHVLNGDGNYGFDLLQKPYSVEDLSRVLRRALSERLAR